MPSSSFKKQLDKYQSHFAFGFLLALLVGGVLLRFMYLGQVPISLYMDEVDHVITGKTLIQFGTDLSGTWHPWQLAPFPAINITAELAAVFHAGVQLLFGSQSWTAYLPNAIFGVLTAILLGLFVKLFTKNNWAAISTTTILLINPWHVFISRLGYEAAISVFFQLLFVFGVFYFLTQKKASRNQIIVSLLTIIVGYFFGYFTYHGAKFTLPIIALTSLGFIWWLATNKQLKIIFSSVILVLVGLLTWHTVLYQATNNTGSRSSELLINTEYLQQKVDEQRRLSLESPLLELTTNKATVFLKEATLHYGYAFDLHRLFFEGTESVFIFSLAVSSFFYLTQFLLLCIGIWWLGKNHQQFLIITLILLLASPVATAISISYQSLFRSAFTYILLNLFSGIGLYVVLFEWKTILQQILKYGIVMLIILETAWFGYNYFARFPILTAEVFDFSDKLLASYVERSENEVIVITSNHSYLVARNILTYTPKLSEMEKGDLTQFEDIWQPIYSLPNVKVSQDCIDYIQHPNATIIIDGNKYQECPNKEYLDTYQKTKHSLSSPLDSGNYFYVYNDMVCDDQSLASFIHIKNISSFDVKSLTDEQFCKTWMKFE